MNNLPKEVKLTSDIFNDFLSEEISECINDYLSEKYGYCVSCYGYEIDIKVTDIEWDTDDEEEE